MKKLLVAAILLALALSACGSSVSKETREEAGKLIDGLTVSLTDCMDALIAAENAAAANEVAATFKTELSAFAEQDAKLVEKEDYFQINTEKTILAQIETLSQTVNSFKRSLNGESDVYTLAAYAQPAARAALADFSELSIYPIAWLNSCAEARELLGALAKLMDESRVAMRDARDGTGVAAALVTYAEGVGKLSVLGTELEAKYPYFKKAASDPSLERPVSDLRSAMVALGKQIKTDSIKYEGKDADFDNGLARMKEILGALKQ